MILSGLAGGVENSQGWKNWYGGGQQFGGNSQDRATHPTHGLFTPVKFGLPGYILVAQPRIVTAKFVTTQVFFPAVAMRNMETLSIKTSDVADVERTTITTQQ